MIILFLIYHDFSFLYKARTANDAIHKTVIFDKTVSNPKGGSGESEKPMFHVYPHNKLVIIQLDERDRAIC